MNRYSFPQDAIDQMKELGFDVYMRNRIDSYVIFANEDGIGYAQYDAVGGFSISSVHRPNRASGTGYQVARDVATITAELLQRAIETTVPRWDYGRQRAAPRKYADIEEYRASDPFKAAYAPV